jgi:hypothetical protein
MAILDQFATATGYLLVTDEDCPFEETFHFILLDENLHVRAHRSLGARFSDDRHFLAFLTGPAERWRFTIRPSGIPFLRPRLTATRL